MKIRPAAVIIESDKLLLLRYVYNGNSVYCLPGGNQNMGETLKDTLKRELQEELGIEISLGELLVVGEADSKEGTTDVLHCIFYSVITDNEPVINKNETSAHELTWIPTDKLESINMYPNIGKILHSRFRYGNEEVYIGKIKQTWF